MKICPYCAEPIQDDVPICPLCHTNLTAPVNPNPLPGAGSPAPTGSYPTSGKAIASLVCGFFPILPVSIVAIILGHLAISDIKRSAGRLHGRALAIVGLVFGYLSLLVIPILIIGAIAIPHLIKSKVVVNETTAVGSLVVINTSCTHYLYQYQSFPATLVNLGPGSPIGEKAANLIPADLASGLKSGYRFTYEPGEPQNGATLKYQVHADPITPGVTGTRHFFTDQSGVIRIQSDGPATARSPALTR